MKTAILIPTLFLLACGPERSIETPEQPEPATAPNPDGDYILYTTVSSQYCGENTEVIEEAQIANVDLIVQNDAEHFTLDTPYNGFLFFDLFNVNRAKEDGSITIEEKGYISFFPGSPPSVWKRWIQGHVWDGIEFIYAFEFGNENQESGFQAYCRMEAQTVSEKRYATKTDAPRTGIDGKWRTKLTVLYDSASEVATLQSSAATERIPSPFMAESVTGFGFKELERGLLNEVASETDTATDLDTFYVTLNITPHTTDASWFSLRGTYFGFDPFRATDGTVEVLATSYGMTTSLTGFVTEEALDLELHWHWYDPATNTTHRELRLRYEGVPRYDQPVAPQDIFGEYLSTYRIVEDTCGGETGQWGRVTDTLPSPDGETQLGITGQYGEPSVHLRDTGGVFSYDFTRRADYELHYQVDGVISPYFLDAKMRIDAYELSDDGSGDYVCHAIYAIQDGSKRFRAYNAETH